MKTIGWLLLATGIAHCATRAVTLSWTASTSAGVTGYNIYRSSTGAAGSFTLLSTTPATATTYTDPVVTVGQTYTYQVTAVAPVCAPSTPTTQACGESDPATVATAIPPRPAATASVTVTVP